MRCICLTLLALIACKDKAPAPPPPPPPPHDGVTLIQPGKAPHLALRYHLTKGTRTRGELVYDVDIKSDDQGGPMPTLVVGFETLVDDVLADGTAKLRLTVIDTSVRERAGSPVTSDAVRAQAAAMKGVIITETLSPDGQLADAHVEAAGLSDKVRAQLENLTRSLQQVATRMPVEPVGIGATWRERRTLPEGGIRAVSEITYTLTSVTDNMFEYTSAGTSSGTPHTVEQDGMTAEVTSVRGTADARGSVDLTRYALAVTSTSTLTTAMKVVAPEGTPGAGPSTIQITTAIQVTAASTDAPPGDAPGQAAPGAAPDVASPGEPKPGGTAPAEAHATARGAITQTPASAASTASTAQPAVPSAASTAPAAHSATPSRDRDAEPAHGAQRAP